MEKYLTNMLIIIIILSIILLCYGLFSIIKLFKYDKRKMTTKSYLETDLYEKLNYITFNNLKKIFKENKLNLEAFEEKDKNLNKIISLNLEFINEEQCNFLIKSGVISVNKKGVLENLKETKNNCKINLEKSKKESEIIDKLLKYDYEYISKNIKNGNDNKFLEAYCNYKNGDFDNAKNVMQSFSKNTNSNELKLWAYYNITLIEWTQKQESRFNEEEKKYFNIDLKKEYSKAYGGIYTDIYEELFNRKTLREVRDSMDKYLTEANESKTTSFSGFSPLNRSKIAIYDFIYFGFLNCYIFDIQEEFTQIILKYIEITLIAYTNKNFESGNSISFFGNKVEMKKFNYLDLYLMTRIPIKKLKNLFYNYKIKRLDLEDGIREEFIEAFTNYLENTQSKFWNKNDIASFFHIFSTLELDNESIKEIFKVLNKNDNLKKIDSFSIRPLSIFIYENKEKIPLEELKKFLLGIFEVANAHWGTEINLIGFLTLYFEEQDIEKFVSKKQIDEFADFFSDRNKKLVKIYLSRIVINEDKEKIKIDILEELDKEIDITVYLFMFFCKIILISEKKLIEKYERKIIEYIKNELTPEKQSYIIRNIHIFEQPLLSIIELNLNGFSTKEFKNQLKNMKNEICEECLNKINKKAMWDYAINPEGFDFSTLEITDIVDSFSIEEIKNILEQDSENKMRKKMEKYLIEKYENDKILEVLFREG